MWRTNVKYFFSLPVWQFLYRKYVNLEQLMYEMFIFLFRILQMWSTNVKKIFFTCQANFYRKYVNLKQLMYEICIFIIDISNEKKIVIDIFFFTCLANPYRKYVNVNTPNVWDVSFHYRYYQRKKEKWAQPKVFILHSISNFLVVIFLLGILQMWSTNVNYFFFNCLANPYRKDVNLKQIMYEMCVFIIDISNKRK